MRLFLSSLGGESVAEQQYTPITTSDFAGYCWFARPRNLTIGTKTAIGTISDYGTGFRSGLTIIDSADDSFTEISLSSQVREDDHDEVSLLRRSSDGRIIACYDEHGTGNFLRWRISTNPDDLSSWGTEKTLQYTTPNADNSPTYSCMYEASDGTIFFFFRSSSFTATHGWCYVKSTDQGETFSAASFVHLTDSLGTERGYIIINVNPNNEDELHFLASRVHPMWGKTQTQKILHGKFNLLTETWSNTSGTTYATRPVHPDSAGYNIIGTYIPTESAWIEDVAVHPTTGYPRVLFYRIADTGNPADTYDGGEVKERFYSEWNGSSWSTPNSMGVVATQNVETLLPYREPMYGPLARFDDNDINTVWESVETAGTHGNILEIYKTTIIAPASYTRRQITFNSTDDQWRPNSIAGGGTYAAYWLNKRKYDRYTDYDQDLIILRKD